jgi:hypothetical protein
MTQTKLNTTQLPSEATTFFNGGTGTHTAVDAHIASTANPHSTTAAQVGAVPNDGWIATAWAGLTRTGATTFTTTTNISAIVEKSYKLKLTDTTTKYFAVYSAVWNGTITTITTIASTDYALVGNPSAVFYSNVEMPFGWPDIFNYTPTLIALTGTLTSYTVNQATWKCIGKQIMVSFNITVTNKGTGSNGNAVSTPVTGATVGTGAGNEGGMTGKMMQLKITAGDWNQIRCYLYDATYPGITDAQLNGSIIYGY